jgi:protein-S-isoprenylcysteine O-methyltransferase Ste14
MGSATRTGWILVAAQLVLLAMLIFAPRGDAWVVPEALEAAGWVFRAAGLAAIVAGVVNLGRSLSIHPKPTRDAVLKTGGLYRYVRHPIYSGVLFLAAGIALTSGSFVSAGAAVLLVPVLSVKARLEERLLTERFPDYPRYAGRTSRFFPGPGRLFR